MREIGIFEIVLVLSLLGIWLWSVVWAYRDAEARGKSGCLVVLLVLLAAWPLGLIIWLVFRPERKLVLPHSLSHRRPKRRR